MLHSTSFRDALRRLLCTRRLDLISLAAAARRLLLAAVREGGTARRLPLKSSLARGSHGCGQSAEAAGAAVVRLWQLLRPLLCPCLTSTARRHPAASWRRLRGQWRPQRRPRARPRKLQFVCWIFVLLSNVCNKICSTSKYFNATRYARLQLDYGGLSTTPVGEGTPHIDDFLLVVLCVEWCTIVRCSALLRRTISRSRRVLRRSSEGVCVFLHPMLVFCGRHLVCERRCRRRRKRVVVAVVRLL